MSGDVVLTEPVDVAKLRPGHVILFTDPAHEDRVLLHRIVRTEADGKIITQGDANESADSTPVAPRDVQGVARLRVPYVGLPVFWRTTGEQVHIVATALALLAACAFVARDGGTQADTDEDDGADPESSAELLPTPAPAAT